MNKYKVIRKNVNRGGKPISVGTVLELTETQANGLVNKVELIAKPQPVVRLAEEAEKVRLAEEAEKVRLANIPPKINTPPKVRR